MLYVNRHDINTLTGRTEVMNFSFHRLMDRPLLGYGFGVEGQIFQNKYFPFWDDLWTTGPRIPIHNGYLSRAIGLGAPAAFLWFFLFLRPFVGIFAAPGDRYGLKKPVVLLLVLPVLILYLSETLGGDCRYPAGVVSTLVWAVAERQRLSAKAALSGATAEAHAFRVRVLIHFNHDRAAMFSVSHLNRIARLPVLFSLALALAIAIPAP